MIPHLRSYINNSYLIKTAFGSFGLKIAAAGIGFLSNIILARLLGPKDLGIYTLIISAIALMATLATLGLPSFVTREVAKYNALEEWGMIRKLINASHYSIALASLVILLLVGVISNWLPFSK